MDVDKLSSPCAVVGLAFYKFYFFPVDGLHNKLDFRVGEGRGRKKRRGKGSDSA